MKALRTCGVYEDILAMPDQMETVLGERSLSFWRAKATDCHESCFGHES